ncbi:MAG: NADH-quinone oxidoreductase subunit N [Saprospiraceae bacterium]|nr:NADH-quinone oxidoreductase subunit N [Saprospiraceae bacterium]
MLSIVILTFFATLVLFLGFSKNRDLILPVSVIGVALAMLCYMTQQTLWDEWFMNMMDVKGASRIFSIVILAIACCILPFINEFRRRGSEEMADFSGLLIYSLIGGIMMVSYKDFMVLFLGIEILSIAMYILAGADRRRASSSEASLKYFILGAFASAILLFGIALYYACTSSFRLDAEILQNSLLLNLSYLLIFAGLAFKIALVPFHFWAPDVYQGTPTIFTATMATIVKVSGFGALYQFISSCGIHMSEWLYWLISLVALASIVVANIMALQQQSVKRMLAYSGIAQAGFILIGFLNLQAENTWPIIFYLIAYAAASLVCFLAVHFVEEISFNDNHSAFKGLYYNNPFLAIVMSIALISLGGGPLTAGFMAKLFVLNNAAHVGNIALVIFALIFAVLSLYYYFRLINQMFSYSKDIKTWRIEYPYAGILAALCIGTIIAGIAPNLLVNLIK